MNLLAQNENGSLRPLNEKEATTALNFAGAYDTWQSEEDRAFDYIEKHGADKFHDMNRYKRLDRARDAFLRLYNKVFGALLRADYDFHLIDELAARSYRDGALGDPPRPA